MPAAIDHSTEQGVILKLERHDRSTESWLKKEYKMHRALVKHVGIHIPTVHLHGNNSNYCFTVMDMLGPDLEDLLQFCGSKFTLKTVLLLADQMILLLECVHHMGLIHRNITPENFKMGIEKQGNLVYLTDLGSAKRYKESDGKHRPYREGRAAIPRSRAGDFLSPNGYQLTRMCSHPKES
jgi:serine/threonine protein kinase